MDIKQNKGYVGIDISVGVLVFLILVPTVLGFIFSINSSKNTESIKSQSTEILVNTLETAKGMVISELNAAALLQNFKAAYESEYNITIEDENSEIQNVDTAYETTKSAIITSNNSTYRLQVKVSDYKKSETDEIKENIIKTVTATITYKVKNEMETKELSTVVVKN